MLNSESKSSELDDDSAASSVLSNSSSSSAFTLISIFSSESSGKFESLSSSKPNSLKSTSSVSPLDSAGFSSCSGSVVSASAESSPNPNSLKSTSSVSPLLSVVSLAASSFCGSSAGESSPKPNSLKSTDSVPSSLGAADEELSSSENVSSELFSPLSSNERLMSIGPSSFMFSLELSFITMSELPAFSAPLASAVSSVSGELSSSSSSRKVLVTSVISPSPAEVPVSSDSESLNPKSSRETSSIDDVDEVSKSPSIGASTMFESAASSSVERAVSSSSAVRLELCSVSSSFGSADSLESIVLGGFLTQTP